MLFSTLTPGTNALSVFRLDLSAVLVILISAVIGLAMVVVFRYTSNQRAIHVAKNQLKAHLLAVRLFQDQLPVVLSSYGRIVRGTGRYLRLAFMPLLIVIVPLTLLMVQIDRYLGYKPLEAGEPFLVSAKTASGNGVDGLSLELPPELQTTAPPVHASSEREVIWRLVASKPGKYDLGIVSNGQKVSKRVVVENGIERLSPIRLQGHFWERLLFSAEAALPVGGVVQSIAVDYPARGITLAGLQWNWIWLFFVLSLLAGFFFKTVLGIEI
jgi:hypothetical protein